ncbi:MAG: transposase, partial [Alphaproteobacteria bacterium]
MGWPRPGDRRTVNGMLCVLETGCWWRDMPAKYGHPMTPAWEVGAQAQTGGFAPVPLPSPSA